MANVGGVAATVLFCTDTFWDDRGDQIVAIDPTVEVVRLVGHEHITPGDLERITVAFFSPDAWPHRAANFMGTCVRANNLKWLQTFSAGTDSPIFTSLRERGVTITNSSGASAKSIAQTVLLYLLALSRDLPRLARAQANRRWEPQSSIDLSNVRLGIVGLGAIGSEVARLAAGFEIETIGLRRTVTGDEICETWTNDRIDELLGWADAIAVTAPLTDDTRGMFDAAAFSRMRPGSWFINVGRGEIVDEPALIDSLVSGHLGGAGLDVFAIEPLPPDSPLWVLPNVIITPHSSGTTDVSHRRQVDMFVDNFQRHAAGESLENLTIGD
jgi:phosphoglycerate dehydrogenase-like enzyme